MKLETKKCLELFDKQNDTTVDWLLKWISETDLIEKKINYLQYRKANNKGLELARRLNELCQK